MTKSCEELHENKSNHEQNRKLKLARNKYFNGQKQ